MAENDENISKKLSAKIDYRIIAAICAGAIAYQVYAHFNSDYVVKNFTILDIPWFVNPFLMGIAGIFVAKRYWGSKVLGKTYLALGIGFLLYFIGSFTYEYLSDFVNPPPDMLPYPSIPDVFFLASYPFLYYHLILNTQFFKKKIEIGRAHV